MMLGNILFLVVIAVVIYMMMKSGGGCCGGHDHSGHDNSGSNKDTDNTHHHQMEGDSSRDRAETDPVSGMEVNDNRIESRHLGRSFHFCSEHCKKVFNLNPNKYAGA